MNTENEKTETDENELTAESFVNLCHALAETDDDFWNGIEIGDYDGEKFVIVDSHDTLNRLNVEINGYTGDSNVCTLWHSEDLNKELNKAESELEKTRIENPNHLGTISRLESRIKKLLNLSAYKRWLHNNEKEEISIDSFSGLTWGFSDEYSMCCSGNGCTNVVRTSPDCYSWTPPLFVDCEGYACPDCARNEFSDYVLEEYKNEQKSIPDDFNTADLGLVKVNDESFENGLYGGQNDTPEPIIKALNAKDIDVWFKVDPGQFDIRFDVYVKTEDLDRAIEVLSETDTKLDYDPAEQCKKALQAASIQQAGLSGEGVKYSTIDVSTGTAETRLVSAEEFIGGIKK